MTALTQFKMMKAREILSQKARFYYIRIYVKFKTKNEKIIAYIVCVC